MRFVIGFSMKNIERLITEKMKEGTNVSVEILDLDNLKVYVFIKNGSDNKVECTVLIPGFLKLGECNGDCSSCHHKTQKVIITVPLKKIRINAQDNKKFEVIGKLAKTQKPSDKFYLVEFCHPEGKKQEIYILKEKVKIS